MKSWKARLLMTLTVLALALAAAMPAIAQDYGSGCEAPEGAKVICKETVTTTPGSDEGDPGLRDATTEDPSAGGTDTTEDTSGSGMGTTVESPFDADCYPFCGVNWPW